MTTKNVLRRIASLSALLCCSVALLAGCGEKPEALVASAKEYRAKNDHNAAIIQLRNALQQQPNNAEARYLLGMSLYATRDFFTAEKELQKALELGYSAERVLPVLGRVMLEIDREAALLSQYGNQKLADADAQATFQTVLGDAYLNERKVAEAKAAYVNARSAKPGYVPARVGETRLLAAQGKLEEAELAVLDILRETPDSIEAMMLHAELLSNRQKLEEAQKLYARILELQPDNRPARNALIATLLNAGKLDKAKEEIEAAKKIIGKRDIRLMFSEAMLNLRQKNYTQARDISLQILRVAPDHGPTLFVAGSAEFALGSLAQAEEQLRKALDRMPRHAGARRALVAVYLRMGQGTRAAETLKDLLDQPEPSSEVYALAGEVALANNDLKKAEEYLQRAAALDKDNAALRSRLGQLRLSTGEVAEGIADLEAASAANSSDIKSDLLLILGHLRSGQYDKAKAAMEVLEKKQPNNPFTFNIKGALSVSMGDHQGARASFEQALALAPTYSPALLNLGRLDAANKEPDAGRKRFEGVLAKEPNNEQVLLAYLQYLEEIRAPEQEVLGIAKRSVESNSSSAIARIALINSYIKSNDKKGALDAAQDALAAFPTQAGVLDIAGRAQLMAGETNQAISTFSKLAGLNPQSHAAQMRLAQAYAASKDVDRSVEALRRALAIKPDLLSAHSDIVAVLTANGRFQEALTEARQVQKRYPQLGLGHVLEGDIHASQKKTAEAQAAYRAALKFEPDNTGLFIKLHRTLSAGGAPQEAEALAARWLKEHPKDIGARAYIAEKEMADRDYKTASAHYKIIVEAQPGNVIALNNLAWLAGQLGDPAALTYAEKAKQIAPQNPAVLDTLGMLLLDKGDTAQALSLLEQAIKLAPQAPGIRLNYAKALMKSGNKDAARRELQSLAKHENQQIRAEAEAALKTL
ncbi:MAG TPA: XrtA/PEP-CTERM system TPR-repeat protein PrsT [Burkholderiales bacterium]|nr:XrtA/PEP-CTERM system TPR-repeat protein PrsT [Burkholderiales bacterium]